MSVREGLRTLELLEMIEVRQGRGAFVVSSDVRPTGRLLRHWLSAHRGEVLELPERSHADHIEIARTIRAGDTSAARAAMQAHIAETRADIGSMPDQGAT